MRDAPDEFSPRSLNGPVPAAKIEPTDELELTGGLKMLADQHSWDQNQRRKIKTGLASVAKAWEGIVEHSRTRDLRCAHISKLISTRKAVAVGFPGGAKNKPEIIPPYLFENSAFINWSQSAVSGNGLNYISVRITKLRRSEQFPGPESKLIENAKRKIGRPSSREYIEAAILELKTDATFVKSPRKSQVLKVIDFVTNRYSKRFPNGKGLRESTVSRYLVGILGH